MIKLISLDVDGTLLDRKGHLPPENKAALTMASDQGVHIILNTGKPLKAVEYLAEMMNFKHPVIAVGGALIVKKDVGDNWRILERTPLPEKSLEAFSPILVDTTLTVILLSTWQTYIYYGDRDVACHSSMVHWLKTNSMEDYTTLNRNEFLNGKGMEMPILNLALHSEEDGDRELGQVYKNLSAIAKPDIMMDYSNAGTVNIVPARAGKKTALEFLCRELGVARHEVMAMGDYDTDLEVVNWAGVGAIMDNAPASVKDRAPMIAPSNDQCGVAKMIEKYVLQKKNLIQDQVVRDQG